MLSIQYEHRLPAEYDMQVIRDRAVTRGPLWDDAPGLALKAFVARERGVHGAAANLYASIYLWQDSDEAAAFLAGETFRSVTDSFGRPQVESWLPLDARRGQADPAATARTIYRRVETLDANADIPTAQAAAVARNRATAQRADTLAAWVALDPASWSFVWFTVSSEAPDAARGEAVYQVWYLAKPGLASLDAA